jgi:dienelactone hydrolase
VRRGVAGLPLVYGPDLRHGLRLMRAPALVSTLALLTLAACGDDAATAIDAAPDAPACALAAPQIAGTPPTDALADSPARCGAPAYQWRRAGVGVPGERGPRTDYSAAQLGVLAQAAGATLPSPPEHAVAIANLSYTTQDRGALVESSTVVAFPTDLPAGVRPPLLLLLHGTSGFRHACGPTVDTQFQLLGAMLASYGWVVVTPDYLGLESVGADYPALHPYLVGEATAIASLDAARAASQALVADGICARPELAVIGGSQGGHAALWVDRLAPYYARELELLGTVATVPPSDLVGHSDRALRQLVPASANVLATLATEAPWYGKAAQLGDVLDPPWRTDVPAALEEACDPGGVVEPSALSDVFTDALLTHVATGSLATFPGFGCLFTENSLLDTSVARITPASPSYGILFVLGEADTLVVPEIERAAYDRMCAAGVPLNYLECQGASHTRATAWSLPEIVDFLAARRARTPFAAQCTRPAASRCRGTPP